MASETTDACVVLLQDKILKHIDEDVSHTIVFRSKKDYDKVVKIDGNGVGQFLGIYTRMPLADIPKDHVALRVICNETGTDERVLYPKTDFTDAPPAIPTISFKASPAAIDNPKGCWVCGKEKTKKCKGCGFARYCSAECQKQAWPNHKVQCREMSKRR